ATGERRQRCLDDNFSEAGPKQPIRGRKRGNEPSPVHREPCAALPALRRSASGTARERGADRQRVPIWPEEPSCLWVGYDVSRITSIPWLFDGGTILSRASGTFPSRSG